jgi:myo-inositol-1(or 4)-monophosphatase
MKDLSLNSQINLPSPATLKRFLEIGTEAALSGGAVLQSYWGNLNLIQEKDRPGDLVTEADKTAEAEILAVLRQQLPEHAILAEESGQIGDIDNDYVWAIDPLDGTTNYAHQYPCYAVSVGLLIRGVPQVGIIFDPSRQELFLAARGLGATCNQTPIHVSSITELSKSLLVTGFAYDRHQTTDNNYAEFCYLTHLTQGVRRSGSAALDLASVACGRLDGYWERGLSPWDITAGIILVEEAGGRVTAYDGNPLQLFSGRLLATNGYLHSSLSKALQQVPPLATWADRTNFGMPD